MERKAQRKVQKNAAFLGWLMPQETPFALALFMH
jgi:hypothetical protein